MNPLDVSWEGTKSLDDYAHELDNLKEAVRAIYYAAYWIPDRPVHNADKLWAELRDAADLPEGLSPKEIK